jgi:hypothetical protein
MNISYLMYQAERPRSAAEQRETDVLTGQLAASVARASHPLTDRRSRKRAAQRSAAVCAIPRPR